MIILIDQRSSHIDGFVLPWSALVELDHGVTLHLEYYPEEDHYPASWEVDAVDVEGTRYHTEGRTGALKLLDSQLLRELEEERVREEARA